MALVLSTDVEGAATAEVHRAVIRGLDPALPPARVYDLQASLVDSMGETRTIGYLVGSFAFLALFLAVIGLYGICVQFGLLGRSSSPDATQTATIDQTETLVDWDEEF